MIRIPDKGDHVYVSDPKHPAYRKRGIVRRQTEGRVYNYDADYNLDIQLDSGELIRVIDLQVSFKRVYRRKRRLRA